jgi:hypothetical protein
LLDLYRQSFELTKDHLELRKYWRTDRIAYERDTNRVLAVQLNRAVPV